MPTKKAKADAPTTPEESPAEEKKNSNPDYTDKAINLCNPPAVLEAISVLRACQQRAVDVKAKIDALDPDLKAEYEVIQGEVRTATDVVRSLIEELGSYQDRDAGIYAVKFHRIFPTYDADKFKANFPKLVPLVVEETVNVAMLKRQLRAKTITEDELKQSGCVTEDTRPQFYIR